MPRNRTQAAPTSPSRMGRYRKAPPVTRLTPVARDPRDRSWEVVDARSVASGDILGAITADMFDRVSNGEPGRPGVNPKLMVRLLLAGVALGASYRKLEGIARSTATLLKVDQDLAPDHVTIHRHCSSENYRRLQRQMWGLGRAWARRAPLVGEQVVVAIDATGMSLTRNGGWAMDKPGSTDRRKGAYDKLHTVIDSATLEILEWELTPHTGEGADAVWGPPLLDRLAAGGWDVKVVCADGAYGSFEMFYAADRLHAKLLTPLPGAAVYGKSDSRNELLTQQSRIGRDVWKKRSGYHSRSPVEALYATTGRQGCGNRLRSKSLATQTNEMALRVAVHNMTRVVGLALAG